MKRVLTSYQHRSEYLTRDKSQIKTIRHRRNSQCAQPNISTNQSRVRWSLRRIAARRAKYRVIFHQTRAHARYVYFATVRKKMGRRQKHRFPHATVTARKFTPSGRLCGIAHNLPHVRLMHIMHVQAGASVQNGSWPGRPPRRAKRAPVMQLDNTFITIANLRYSV